MRRAVVISIVVGMGVLFAVVITASIILPARKIEAKLLTSPSDKHFSVSIGKPFEITCIGESSTDEFSDITWISPKGEIVSTGDPRTERKSDTSLKLMFTDPKKDDSGTYQCTAIYGEGHALKTEVSVSFVDSIPTFESQYEKLLLKEGSEAKVTCTAVGEKPITYTWFNERDEKIPDIGTSSIYTSISENGSTLIIRPVRQEDGGSYICRAENQYGTSSKVYEIAVISSPNNDTMDDAIRYVRLVNVRTNSVKFDIDTSERVTAIQVSYTESREKHEVVEQWNIGDDYTVDDLIPAGLYTFEFTEILSDSDIGSQSHKLRVVTLPDVPEVVFRNLESHSVKIEWIRNFDDIMRGTVDKYQIKYYSLQREGGRTWKVSDCAVTIELTSCSGAGYTIAGLYSTVYYELEVRAHTESGFGEPFKQKIYIS